MAKQIKALELELTADEEAAAERIYESLKGAGGVAVWSEFPSPGSGERCMGYNGADLWCVSGRAFRCWKQLLATAAAARYSPGAPTAHHAGRPGSS